MEIPFAQVNPDGTGVVRTIRRGPRIERLAHMFLRSGGRFAIKVHPLAVDGPNVEIVAMIPTPGSVQPWARVTEAWCYDDPALPQAIDQLVIDAMAARRQDPTIVIGSGSSSTIDDQSSGSTRYPLGVLH
jgi:hypothetical protein